jgi:hypothetical protein
MSEHKALRNGPGKIALPADGLDTLHESALTDTPLSLSQAPNPFLPSTPFSPPQWNPQEDEFHNMYTGDEPPEIPDRAPIPVALPMSSAAGVTPLPLLPMTVLSIVGLLSLSKQQF